VIADAPVSPVLTDIDGKFAVAPVPAGRYVVSAMKAGYATVAFRANGWEQDSRVDVAAGKIVDGIDIRLPKGAAITGRVLDDLGGPMPLLTIVAERVVRRGGRVEFKQESSVETDDTGVYRLFGLPAGEFVLASAGGRFTLVVAIDRRQGADVESELVNRSFWSPSSRTRRASPSLRVGPLRSCCDSLASSVRFPHPCSAEPLGGRRSHPCSAKPLGERRSLG
jgi:hypothetical protein